VSTSVQWWPVRPIDENSFTDILPNNPVESINWEVDPLTGQPIQNMIVTFGGDPLTKMQRYEVIRRMRTTPAQEAQEKAAVSAYQAMTDYINLTRTPTNGEVVARVKANTIILRELVKQAFPIAAKELLGP
jgi:hypothetical protein